MKTKKFEKKLVLNKMTVSNLNGNEMLGLRAGNYSAAPPTCEYECETYTISWCFTHCIYCEAQQD